MGVLIWLTISLVCLIVFLIVNRWGKWVRSGGYADDGFTVALLCLVWPFGIIIFICMIAAKLMDRFLP